MLILLFVADLKRRRARLEAQRIENLSVVLTTIGNTNECVIVLGRKLVERAIEWKIRFAMFKRKIILRVMVFEESFRELLRKAKHARIEIP